MYIQRVKRCHKLSFERNSADQKTVYSRSTYGIVEYNQITRWGKSIEKENAESVTDHASCHGMVP